MGMSLERLGLADDQLRRGVDICGVRDDNVDRCGRVDAATGAVCDLSARHLMFWPNLPHEQHGQTMSTRDVIHAWPGTTYQQELTEQVMADMQQEDAAARAEQAVADRAQEIEAGATELADAPDATRRLLTAGPVPDKLDPAVRDAIDAAAHRYMAYALQGLDRVLILVEDREAPRGDRSRYPGTFELDGITDLRDFPTASAGHRLIERGWMPLRQVGDGTRGGWTGWTEGQICELAMPVHAIPQIQAQLDGAADTD